MQRAWFVAIFALLVAARLAQAQAISSPYDYVETTHSVGLYGGYLNARPGELGLSTEPAPLFGARYTLHLTGPVSAEAALGVFPTTRTVKARLAGSTILTPIGEVDSFVLDARAGFLFNITGARTWRGLSPYLLATAGVVTNLSGTDAIEGEILPDQRYEFGPALALTPGVGAQLFVNRWLSFRLEVTDHLWRLEYPSTLTNTGDEETEWLHNPAISLGSAVHF